MVGNITQWTIWKHNIIVFKISSTTLFSWHYPLLNLNPIQYIVSLLSCAAFQGLHSSAAAFYIQCNQAYKEDAMQSKGFLVMELKGNYMKMPSQLRVTKTNPAVAVFKVSSTITLYISSESHSLWKQPSQSIRIFQLCLTQSTICNTWEDYFEISSNSISASHCTVQTSTCNSSSVVFSTSVVLTGYNADYNFDYLFVLRQANGNTITMIE